MQPLWTCEDLVSFLEDPDEIKRTWAIKALNDFFPDRPTVEVADFIGYPNDNIALEVSIHLTRHKMVEYAPKLLNCFKEDNGRPSDLCVYPLGIFGWEPALDELIAQLHRTEQPTRLLGILDYLVKINNEKAHSAVRAHFEENRDHLLADLIAGSLFRFLDPDDIPLVLDSYGKNKKKLDIRNAVLDGMLTAVGASESYRSLNKEYNFSSKPEVSLNAIDLKGISDYWPDFIHVVPEMIRARKYLDLLDLLIDRSRELYSDRYGLDPGPVWLDHSRKIDYMALNILEYYANNNWLWDRAKRNRVNRENQAAALVSIYLSMGERAFMNKALSPEAEPSDITNAFFKKDDPLYAGLYERLKNLECEEIAASLTPKFDDRKDIWLIRAMRDKGDPSFIPVLLNIIRNADLLDQIDEEALRAFSRMGSEAGPSILAAMKEMDDLEPFEILEILEYVPYPEAFDMAADIWNKADDHERIDIAEFIGVTLEKIGDPRGIDLIVEMGQYDKENFYLLEESIITLCALHDRDIPEVVQAAIYEMEEYEDDDIYSDELYDEPDDDEQAYNELENLIDDENDEYTVDNHGTVYRDNPKIGRNDPCPCGSGKKYKKCCLKKAVE